MPRHDLHIPLRGVAHAGLPELVPYLYLVKVLPNIKIYFTILTIVEILPNIVSIQLKFEELQLMNFKPGILETKSGCSALRTRVASLHGFFVKTIFS